MVFKVVIGIMSWFCVFVAHSLFLFEWISQAGATFMSEKNRYFLVKLKSVEANRAIP
jgi:hypothetical protein